MPNFNERVSQFLKKYEQAPDLEQLTPDASTREYFRIRWSGQSAIACVYPEPFVAVEQTYLDVTRLFENNGLPVARVFTFDEALGVIVQEDLGDTILRDVLESSSPERREQLIDEAIGMIAQIQHATANAYETDSVASLYAHVATETRAALMATDERDWQAALQARCAISPISPVAVLDALLSPLRPTDGSKHSDPRLRMHR